MDYSKSDLHFAFGISRPISNLVNTTCSTAFLVLAILKLVKLISLSWWIICAPIYGGFAFNLLVVFIVWAILKYTNKD